MSVPVIKQDEPPLTNSLTSSSARATQVRDGVNHLVGITTSVKQT